jgi:hypothetical protein
MVLFHIKSYINVELKWWLIEKQYKDVKLLGFDKYEIITLQKNEIQLSVITYMYIV